MGGVVVGGRLRSRLLVGVAALAMAGPASTRALAQSVDKWQPYLEAGGMVGINAHSFGDVDIFLPLWQDQTSMFFGNLHGQFSAAPSQEGNFGLGYRTQISPDWILGGYGFIDIQNSKNDNLFFQGSLGAELLSVDWDFRVNGYLPFNGSGQTISGGNGTSGHLGIFGNNFGFKTNDVEKEYALYGFDGEVGWRIPIFPVDGDMDLRIFAGGYYFARSDVDTIAGPRGRIEARLYDIDFLGLQSRLTAQGIVQWDQPRGTQGFAGLELRIPLGVLTGSNGPKLNPLDRRMVDRVQRDLDIVTETAKEKGNVKLQEVQVDELTVTTHTAVFADGQGGSGDPGTQKKPTDLNDAPARGEALGSNAVIIAQGNRGDHNVTNPVQLSNGQALIGGGSVVPLTLIGGKHDGEVVNFSFPGSRPTVVGDNASVNLIDMAKGSQNRITGLDLTGSFSNGIFGSDMERAIITNNTISGAAGNGILLTNAIDPDPAVVPPSAFVDIRENTIVDSGENGIAIKTYIGPADHSAHTQSIRITGNTIASNALDGVFISNFVNGAGSSLVPNLYVFANVVSGNDDGVHVLNRAQSSGAIFAGVAMFGNEVTDNTDDGILLDNFASSGAGITQFASISYNTVDNNGIDGIGVFNAVKSSGDVFQILGIVRNTVTSNGADGIFLRNYAESTAGGIVTQLGSIADNTVDHNDENGLDIVNEARTGGTVIQQMAVSGGTFSYNGRDGIFGKNVALGAGAVIGQFAVVSNAVVTNNDLNGIRLENIATSGASVLQTVVIDPSTITSNGLNGIYGHNQLTAATISQTVEVLDDTISNNTSNGIRFNNVGYGIGGQLDQTVVVSGTVIASNGVNGFVVRNHFGQSAGLSQDISIAASTIAENASHGVFISSSLYGTGGFTQGVSILSSRIVSNPGGGIEIKTFGSSSASVTEHVTIGGNVVSYNGSNGVEVKDHVTDGSTLSQTVRITDNVVKFDSSRGIDVRAIGYSSSTVVQDVLVDGNTVSQNGSDGIRIKAVEGPGSGLLVGGSLTQTVVVTGNSVDRSSKNGIYVAAFAASVTAFVQDVTVANNLVTRSGLSNGIAIITSLDTVSTPATEILSVTDNVVKYSGSDGIFVRTSLTGAGTTLTQTSFAIDRNRVGKVPEFGIFVSNDVTTGTTLSQGSIAIPATINDNGVYSVSSGGIIVSNNVVGIKAALSQALTIDGNTVFNIEYDHGILVSTNLQTQAVAVQTVSIGGNTVGLIREGFAVGIGVRNDVGDDVTSGAMRQTLAITDNAVIGIFGTSAIGIYVRNFAGEVATISQTAVISRNTVTYINGVQFGGAIVNANTAGVLDARITQTISINDNHIFDVAGPVAVGIANLNSATAVGTTIAQTLTIDPNTVTYIGGTIANAQANVATGILVSNAVGPSATLSQAVSIQANLVTHVHAYSQAGGIVVATNASSGAVAVQAISIGGNFVSLVAATYYAVGIAVRNRVGDSAAGADLSQTLAITDNTVTDISADGEGASAVGIYVGNVAGRIATISQTALIARNTVTAISMAYGFFAGGIVAVNEAARSGATITQVLGINDNTVTDIHGFLAVGIDVFNGVSSGATVLQALTIDPNTVTLVGGTSPNFTAVDAAAGILVANNVGADALLSQSVNIVGNHVSTISGYESAVGIKVQTFAFGAGGSVSQTVNIGAASGGGNTVTNIDIISPIFGRAAGIDLLTDVEFGASASQTVNVLANTVKTVTGPFAEYVYGIVVYNRAADVGVITQALVVAQNSVSAVDGDGIKVSNIARYASFISQAVTVGSATVGLDNFGGNQVTDAGLDGVRLKAVDRYGGSVLQSGGIVGNTVTGVGGTGIEVSLEATSGGSYVSQFLSVSFNKISNNGGGLVGAGITFKVSTYNPGANSARGDWTMEGNSIATNFVGLNLRVYGSDATQFVDLTTSNAANSFGNFITSNGVGVNAQVTDGYQAVNLYSQLGPTGGPNKVQGNVLFNTVYFSNAGSTQNFNK